MFDILFGWRKASKCKKLIKRVQCRLKLLKNKRCCIVKQLREDVAELLKHGHDQSAFERVEQLIMDESMIQVYDLLDQFCEFIIINLPYIRIHRDCPNDINEAASTLIFSSARFGDLPELLSIRKLFGERYSQRFVTVALELLPGNLVNNQIKENLYMKKVSDDVKYIFLDEIARTCIQTGPLFLEYKPELQEDQQASKGSIQMSCREVQTHDKNEAPEIQLYIGRETEGKIIYVDLPSENKEIWKEPCFGLRKEHKFLNSIQDLDPVGEKSMKPAGCNEMESSSETSAKLPEEVIYLDDIEEFVSPVGKDGNLQDQRLFKFKSFGVLLNEKTYYGIDKNLEEQKLSQENSVSKSSRKSRKASRKRSRRRSVLQENRTVTDIECATYYGESCETSPDNRHKSHYQRDLKNKILVQQNRKSCFSLVKSRDHNLELSCRCNSSGATAKKCSLEHPCYFNTRNENEEVETKDFAMRSLKEEKILYGLEFCKYSQRGEREDDEADEQNPPTPLRAMTMPSEWPKENPLTDNINRSNSFPLGHSSCRHIHPKLPEYDELEAKFMELKRANLQNKQKSSNLQI